jgi:ParB-like chromosome segregation protein Spo0J
MLSIETVSIDSLIPYERNAKKHPQEQIDALAREIKDVGFTQPIVIDKDNVIVVGHGRAIAAKQLGMTKVPVHRLPADMSDERIRAIRLFDNKISETEWDKDLLQSELVELASLDFDMSLTGFDSPSGFDFQSSSEDGEEQLDKEPSWQLRIEFENEDQQQALFVELRDRGLKVKV